jgi:hypothetical protein
MGFEVPVEQFLWQVGPTIFSTVFLFNPILRGSVAGGTLAHWYTMSKQPDVDDTGPYSQDPIPTGTSNISQADVTQLKENILAADIGVSALVRTAWSAASSFRRGDPVRGVNHVH